MQLNSKEYWDKRFTTDWVSKYGKEQSAFFGQIAMNTLPIWLISDVKRSNLTIGDWGCALGDGTQEIKKKFPESIVSGIDFSAAAILKAKEYYKELNFICEDILNKPSNLKYDIIFSSNTLEHFTNPWAVLNELTKYSERHIIILIPYRESELYGEHLYSFADKNIVSKINNSYSLTHFEIIDAGKLIPSFWGGQQLLLVYSKEDVIPELNLQKVTHTDLSISEIQKQQLVLSTTIFDSKLEIFEELKNQAITNEFIFTACKDIITSEVFKQQSTLSTIISESNLALLEELKNQAKTNEILFTSYKDIISNKDTLINNYNALLEIRSLISANKTLEEELVEAKMEINTLQTELKIAKNREDISKDYSLLLSELKQLLKTKEGEWKQELSSLTLNLVEKELKFKQLESCFSKKEEEYALLRDLISHPWTWKSLAPHLTQEELQKLQYDLYYIKNRSFLFDLEIILKTIYYIFTWKGR